MARPYMPVALLVRVGEGESSGRTALQEKWFLQDKLGWPYLTDVLTNVTSGQAESLPLKNMDYEIDLLTAGGDQVSVMQVIAEAFLYAARTLKELNRGVPYEAVKLDGEARIYAQIEEVNQCQITLSFTLSCPSE